MVTPVKENMTYDSDVIIFTSGINGKKDDLNSNLWKQKLKLH